MLLPKQIWKDIEGFEGLYQVSNTGRVRSLNYLHTGKTKVMKQNTDKDGYRNITLKNNNKCKTYFIHRLVALAFIPNPLNLPQVNHIDENKTNNAVWNLEWCTQEYNINYGTRNKRISEARKGRQFTKETKRKMSENHADFKGKNNPMYGKKGKNNPNYDKGKAILMFTKDGQFIRRFNCVAEANKFLGKDRNNTNIGKCIRGENGQRTAWGYRWIYEMED